MTRLSPELLGRIRDLMVLEPLVLLGITGPPGSGKTTLAAAVVAQLPGAVHLPMDGFHLADVELTRLGRRNRKGAVDTFDGHGYLTVLQRVRNNAGEIVYAPMFDRALEQPVAGAIPVLPGTRLVVTEGNYLLDDLAPWSAVRGVLSQVWYLEVDAAERRRRLIARHEQFGKPPDAARAWVSAIDERNAERVEAVRGGADVVVTVTAHDEWKVL